MTSLASLASRRVSDKRSHNRLGFTLDHPKIRPNRLRRLGAPLLPLLQCAERKPKGLGESRLAHTEL